jgi:hypothetical protein
MCWLAPHRPGRALTGARAEYNLAILVDGAAEDLCEPPGGTRFTCLLYS